MMEATEELALEKATPYLRALCKKRWSNLEYEDRLAEVQFIFLLALRQFSTNSGHFLEDFCAVLTPYMDELNKRTPSLYYTLSLDAAMQTKNGADNCTSYHFLAARDYSESQLYVTLFLESLPAHQQRILKLLLSGVPKTQIAVWYGMTTYQLNVLLRQIGDRYLVEYGID